VLGVIFTALVYSFNESLFYVFLKILNIEFLVLLVKIVKELSLVLDIFVDTEECWNFLGDNMNKIFSWQIFKKDLGSFSSMFREII
jgi:hypothetical protein